MKIQKVLFLSIFLMMILLFIPNIVNAEDVVGVESVFITLDNIKLGGKGQDSTYAIGGSHFITPTINITWYESSNGSNYTLVDENSTFDYNIYYKAVLDTSYDELNGGFDDGWELGGLSIDIVDAEGNKLDSKSYNSSSKLEYVFEPFWKYKVNLVLENLEYCGPSEIIEGESLNGQLVPKKNYRLPTTEEARDYGMIRISINGNTTSNSYNSHNGMIEIPSQDIKGYIEILARAVEKEKIEFNNNREYIYVKDNNLDFAVSFEQHIDTLYINEKIVSEDDYSFDRENGILTLNESFLNKLEVGTYVLRIENNNRYAETNFFVKELEIVETYKVKFDANGGMFENENTLTIEKWENGLENSLEQPIRNGYAFMGYFTEKTGGTKLELILAESGIDSDMTFYAQWKKTTIEDESSSVPSIPDDEEQEDNNTQDSGNTNQGNTNASNTNIGADNDAETGNNPQTSDNIMLFVLILSISTLGIIITTKIRKNR